MAFSDHAPEAADEVSRLWIVISTNRDCGWLNDTRFFRDEARALTVAKGLAQNPETQVTVIEPSGEEWEL